MQLTGSQFYKLLQTHPQSVTWSDPRSLTLKKTPSGSLGLKIRTFQPPQDSSKELESTTVVYKIQPECTIQNSSLLANYDRIVSVDGKPIVNSTQKEVYRLFEVHTKDAIALGICRIVRLPFMNSQATNNRVDDRRQQVPLSQIATSNTIQRHFSRGSSDSGRGSSPRSGDTNGCFDFTSTNSSVRSSGHSLDDTIASSSQTVSVKRSSSGSSTCSQVCSQSGQRKTFSCKHQDQYLDQPDNLSGSGSCSLCMSQHTICAPCVTSFPQCDWHCGGVHGKDITNSGSSVPLDFSLSELHLWASRERTHSLPLPSELASPHIDRSSTCQCQSYDTINNLSSGMAKQTTCNKQASVSSSCSPKVFVKHSREQKGSNSDCLSIAQQILNHPENVKWDPNTKVVTLERNNKKTPGITFKFKHHKNKDGTVDLYNLVEEVDKGGLADGKLMVGDWIRSIDGNPVHGNQTQKIRELLDKQASVRFVLQRPVDLRGWNINRDGKSRKQCNYNPSPSAPGVNVHRQLESSPRCSVCSPQNLVTAVNPRHADPSKMPPKMERYLSTVSHSSNASGRRHSPHTPPVCTCSNNVSSSYLRSVSTVCEPPDWISIARNMSSMEEYVKFPSLQLFIAGSHALKMTELLFNSSNQPVYAMGKEKFLHIRCYVCEDAYGVTKLYLHDDLPATENDVLNGVISQCFDTQISVCEDDIELDVSTQVGCGPQSRCYSRLTSRSQNSNPYSIALDVYVVTDEKFFTRCCHFMFSKNTLFFITFDGAKVLESTSEMTKIGQMVHSSQAACGADTPLFLYGFLDGDSTENESPKADELKALFYTDHGRQILRYPNVAMPLFIVLQPSVGGSVDDQGYEARQLIGQIVLHQEHLSGHMHLATLSVMSWVLQQQRDGRNIAQLGELRDTIISILPEIQECQLTKIIHELQVSGMIRLTSSENSCKGATEQQLVLLKPSCLLQCLQTLLSGLDRLSASSKASPRKSTTGIKFPTAASDKMLKAAFQISNCSSMTFNEMILFLEKFLVVQNVWMAPDTYLLPYFCQESQTPGEKAEHENELVLYVELDKVISTGVFLRTLNNLAKHCQASELSSLSLYSACLTLDEWNISWLHLWKDDLIKISLRSTKVNLPSTPPLGFVNNVVEVFQSTLPNSVQFHLCVPCPLGEDCQTDKGRQPHLVDIQQGPNFCGNVRVDNKKTVKMWVSTLSTKQSKLSCQGNEDPPEDPPSPQEKKFDLSMPVLLLPYSLLHNLFLQLRLRMPRGNDWTGFAACIGKTGQEVALYETQKNPPQDLVTEWARMTRATVSDLIDVLSHPEMERVDLVDMVKQALNMT
ncbi:uncharacterized protein LOC135470422 [Liolophura sinensis]|uniref:uncharacterized protein LOC135470422 n=1 Tax=Liolophura sinensis TaxID=3198878 RepID=UPI0031585D3B